MSAIQSLLRVMTLRDAEAIILEADKVPSLRRRGQIEKLAMPALDRQLLADFTGPLLAGRSLDDGPASVAFHEPGGAHYQVTMEKLATGLRVVVRPGKPPANPAPAAATSAAAPAPASPPARSTSWWAQPSAGRAAPAAHVSGPNAPTAGPGGAGEPASISPRLRRSDRPTERRGSPGCSLHWSMSRASAAHPT